MPPRKSRRGRQSPPQPALPSQRSSTLLFSHSELDSAEVSASSLISHAGSRGSSRGNSLSQGFIASSSFFPFSRSDTVGTDSNGIGEGSSDRYGAATSYRAGTQSFTHRSHKGRAGERSSRARTLSPSLGPQRQRSAASTAAEDLPALSTRAYHHRAAHRSHTAAALGASVHRASSSSADHRSSSVRVVSHRSSAGGNAGAAGSGDWSTGDDMVASVLSVSALGSRQMSTSPHLGARRGYRDATTADPLLLLRHSLLTSPLTPTDGRDNAGRNASVAHGREDRARDARVNAHTRESPSRRRFQPSRTDSRAPPSTGRTEWAESAPLGDRRHSPQADGSSSASSRTRPVGVPLLSSSQTYLPQTPERHAAKSGTASAAAKGSAHGLGKRDAGLAGRQLTESHRGRSSRSSSPTGGTRSSQTLSRARVSASLSDAPSTVEAEFAPEQDAVGSKSSAGRRGAKSAARAWGSVSDDDPWLSRKVPCSFIASHLRRRTRRLDLCREFLVFLAVLLMFCFYAEFHFSLVERSFYMSAALRLQLQRQEFPSLAQQVDVFRQEQENGFTSWLNLDNYYDDITSPRDWLQFVRDVVIGYGGSAACAAASGADDSSASTKEATGCEENSNSSVCDDVDASVRADDGISTRALQAFTRDGGAPFARVNVQRTGYFVGALRLRTIRLRNGTGTLQRSLYGKWRGGRLQSSGRRTVVHEIYAKGHASKDESTAQLCPKLYWPVLSADANTSTTTTSSSSSSSSNRDHSDSEHRGDWRSSSGVHESSASWPGLWTTPSSNASESASGYTRPHLYRYVRCDEQPYHAGRIIGEYGSYHCGGHVVDIPFTYSAAEAQQIAVLLASPSCSFIDSFATRLAVAEFFVYYPFVDTWVSVKFRTEVTPAGALVSCGVVRTFGVYTNARTTGELAFACVTFVLVVLYFFLLVIYKVYYMSTTDVLGEPILPVQESGTRQQVRAVTRYVCALWLYLDLAFVAAAAVSFGFFFRWVQVSKREIPSIRGTLSGSTTAYPVVLDELQRLYERSRVAACVALAALFVRVLYFCRFFSSARALIQSTMSANRASFAALAVAYTTILVGYALAGWAVFGPSTAAFSTIGDAMTTLLQLATGTLNYLPSELSVTPASARDRQVNEQFVFLYFWSYFALVFCVAVCLFVALVSNAYEELTRREYLASNDPRWAFRAVKVLRSRADPWYWKTSVFNILAIRDERAINRHLLQHVRRVEEAHREAKLQRVVDTQMLRVKTLWAEMADPLAHAPAYSTRRRAKQTAGQAAPAPPVSSVASLATCNADAVLDRLRWLQDSSASTASSSTRGCGADDTTSGTNDRVIDEEELRRVLTAELRERAKQFTLPDGVRCDSPPRPSSSRSPHTLDEHRGTVSSEDSHPLCARELPSSDAPTSNSASNLDNHHAVLDHLLSPSLLGVLGERADTHSVDFAAFISDLPEVLLTECGGLRFLRLLWIELVAQYESYCMSSVEVERRRFMREIAQVTQQTAGVALETVEQLDATLTQLEAHITGMRETVAKFLLSMARMRVGEEDAG